MIRFRVDGIPKGQPRPRAFAKGGKARVYDPGTAEHWKAQIVQAGRERRPEQPFEGPVYLEIEFLLPRPKRLMRKKDLSGAIPMPSKPDLDNLVKAILDALTHDGWWRDDCQVTGLEATKMYVAKEGQRPGATIIIYSKASP